MFVTLPKSSLEEAVRHFQTAEELKPNFMCRNQFAMAKTLERLNRFEEAVYWMRKASQFQPKTPKDQRDKQDAIEVLNKWATNSNFAVYFK